MKSELSTGLLKVVLRLIVSNQVSSLSKSMVSSLRLPSTQERPELLGNNPCTLKDVCIILHRMEVRTK